MNSETKQLSDRLAATKDRLVREHADYEGACAVRDAMEAMRPKYGGPHDDAADAWAAARGMRVVGWREWKPEENYILWSWQEPNEWGDVAGTVRGSDGNKGPRYIVKPLALPPTQPDPLADLRRRVEALEAAQAKPTTLISGGASVLSAEAHAKIEAALNPHRAPPRPPLPVVPECGYWERDGKRYVLAEPVEWRKAERDEAFLFGRMTIVAINFNGEYPDHVFILTELTAPQPPAGYVVDGWRKPKLGDAYMPNGSSEFRAATSDRLFFAWVLKSVPVVKRRKLKAFLEGPEVHLVEVPVVDDGSAVRLDRERIMLEEIERSGVHYYDRTFVAARLAEIRAEVGNG